MEAIQTVPPPDTVAGDDIILPFQAELAGASGRLVRLGPAVDEILRGHAYPEPVCKLLGEAVALCALLGASLKFEGKFIFQTKTDGPVNMLVADYRSSGDLRGFASFDAQKFAALENMRDMDSAELLGGGTLAMTVDRGPDMERNQGIVELEGGDLNQAAAAYFRQSEQLPTFIRVAVARHYSAENTAERDDQNLWRWRAGGLILQHLTREGGHGARARPSDEDGWNRASTLAATLEDSELVDPMLAPEDLLYRLFHDEQVRAFKSRPLAFHCGCSPRGVKAMLGRFSGDEIKDMVEDGRIRVTCEFCNSRYDFDPGEF